MHFGSEYVIFEQEKRFLDNMFVCVFRPAPRQKTCSKKKARKTFLEHRGRRVIGAAPRVRRGRGDGRREPPEDPANFTGLVLGCIEAKFCM